MSLRKKIIAVSILSITLCGSLSAQITADEAIGFIDQLPASRLDPGLPRTPFLAWLNELVGPAAKIHWEMNDCGELTGVATVDEERDISVCIEATIQLSESQKVGIAIRIGSEKKGLSESPKVANIFWETGEQLAYFKSLSELQKALTTPRPAKRP
jgi:hypothetical protein